MENAKQKSLDELINKILSIEPPEFQDEVIKFAIYIIDKIIAHDKSIEEKTPQENWNDWKKSKGVTV